MQSRLFQGQQQEKINPIGLQYIVRIHDVDIILNCSGFYGVELIFDSHENLIAFKDLFDNLDSRELKASVSNREKIGHLTNKHKSFCDVTIMLNSKTYILARENYSLSQDGGLIFEELAKRVQLNGVAILDFNIFNQTFIKPQDVNVQEDDFSDAPGHLRCPLSQELMQDPITLSNGITYNRWSLIDLSAEYNYPEELLCPATKLTIQSEQLNFKTNVTIKNLIAEYKEEKKAAKINEHKDESSDQMDVEECAQFRV